MAIHRKPIFIGFSGSEVKNSITAQVSDSTVSVTFNHGVLGSIPSALTKEIKGLRDFSEDQSLVCTTTRQPRQCVPGVCSESPYV
jgi:hypothetical protein